MKWCAGCARVILCAGWRKRGRRTVGDAGAVGQAKPLRLTQPRHSSEHGASRTPPPTVGARHTLRHMARRMRFLRASQWCAGCARGIGCVGRWTRGRRTVCLVVKIGRAERLRLMRLGNPANTGRRGRRPLRAVARHTLRDAMKRALFRYAHQWCAGCARGI